MNRFLQATQQYFTSAKSPLFVSLATVGRDGKYEDVFKNIGQVHQRTGQ
jgi:hypothetical protein